MSEVLNAYKATVSWAAANHIESIARDVTSSTNAEAKNLLDQLGSRALIIANHQTSGRGRGDHTWSDSAGDALLSSWIFRVSKSPQPIMSALIGLALFESASSTWPSVNWALKAPNDLHVVDQNGEAKKVAGILIELTNSALAQVSVVVGVGMNVSSAPEGTRPYKATALAHELSSQGRTLDAADWSKFLTTWIAHCDMRIAEGLEPEIRSSARESLRLALQRHPEYRSLREIEADGSLLFDSGRRIDWNSL
jgi:BirA family transcriptional regulator, biotin operon repressor / biotin---[acetyl-CoA-carboxylase] ligase